jgi:hypothetical protein
MKAVIFVTIFAFCAGFGFAQNNISNTKENIKINQNQPSVFIKFERFGKRKPVGDDESEDKVWLKLHNNTRWSIYFCIFNLYDKHGNEASYENAVESGINYQVEKVNKTLVGAGVGNSTTKFPEEDNLAIPRGMPTIHGCSLYELASGESALFNVEKRELTEKLRIKIKFNYEWETETNNSPLHYVYFNGLSLPK